MIVYDEDDFVVWLLKFISMFLFMSVLITSVAWGFSCTDWTWLKPAGVGVFWFSFISAFAK